MNVATNNAFDTTQSAAAGATLDVVEPPLPCLQPRAAGPASLRVLRPRHRLRGHRLDVTCVAPLSDSQRLLSGAEDGTVRLWDLEAGVAQLALRPHSLRVTDVAASPDGRLVASAGIDHVVSVYDVVERTERFRHAAPPMAQARFSPDGRHLVVADWNAVRSYRVDSGTEVATVRGRHLLHGLLSDGRALVGNGRLLDLETGDLQDLWVLDRSTTDIRVEALSADGRYILLRRGPRAGKVVLAVMELPRERLVSRLVLPWSEFAGGVFLASDPVRFASLGLADLVQVWNLSGECLYRGHLYEPQTGARSITPDGRYLIGWWGMDLTIWETIL